MKADTKKIKSIFVVTNPIFGAIHSASSKIATTIFSKGKSSKDRRQKQIKKELN